MADLGNITLPADLLDKAMPMHILLDLHGRIVRVGPTMAKILGVKAHKGARIWSSFQLRRPSRINSIEQIKSLAGAKIHLRLKDQHFLPIISTISLVDDEKLILLNLSFGYKIVEAVSVYSLAGSDFAPTDLAVEMLYLVEAQNAAMAASSQMAMRLDSQKQEAVVTAKTDGLTRLGNRRALDDQLERFIHGPHPFALMQVDLDFFKAVNDTLGHAAGDTVLVKVAEILREETRDSDFVARVGGDEFVILLSRLSSPEILGQIATRIIAHLEQPVPYREHMCKISASIGISMSVQYESDQISGGEMMEDADKALYKSKEAGRACYFISDREIRQ